MLFRRFSEGEEEQFKAHREGLRYRYKENPIYPDLPSLIFYNDYFYKIAFSNYILDILKRYKDQYGQIVILELGSHKSRNVDLLPEDLKERTVISDINFDVLEENPADISKIQLDFSSIPMKDESVSLLIGTNVFSHILGLGNIEEIKRVLNRNGEAIFIEDLSLYMPTIALFFEKQGYKTYFLLDPDEGLKCFVIEREKFESLKEQIKKTINNFNLETFREIIESNFSLFTLNYFNNLLRQIGAELFNINPFLFSLYLFGFINQFKTELIPKTKEERERLQPLNQFFNNLLSSLIELLESNAKYTITKWEDILEYLEEFLKNYELSLEKENIVLESTAGQLKKYQEEVIKRINTENLRFHNPVWENLIERKNQIAEDSGIEIGYTGEKILHNPGIVRYNMLILRIKRII